MPGKGRDIFIDTSKRRVSTSREAKGQRSRPKTNHYEHGSVTQVTWVCWLWLPACVMCAFIVFSAGWRAPAEAATHGELSGGGVEACRTHRPAGWRWGWCWWGSVRWSYLSCSQTFSCFLWSHGTRWAEEVGQSHEKRSDSVIYVNITNPQQRSAGSEPWCGSEACNWSIRTHYTMQETKKDPGGDVFEPLILEHQTAGLLPSSHISRQSLHGPSDFWMWPWDPFSNYPWVIAAYKNGKLAFKGL